MYLLTYRGLVGYPKGMKAYTLNQLKLADELAFPENMKPLFMKHLGEEGIVFYSDWLTRHNRSLISQIFNYSRADFERGLEPAFEAIIDDLIA
jgi:hypothetical protein